MARVLNYLLLYSACASIIMHEISTIFISCSDLIEVGYDPTLYTTSEGEGMVELNIFVFSHPVTGTPRPFNLSVNTQDGTAGTYMFTC